MEISEEKEMHMKKYKNRWDFLDEIEAPMWVDLTIEPKYSYNNNDDQWFHTSHPFHQCSSQRLKSDLFGSFKGSSSTSDIGLQGSSSPKIPASVSRSRGKDYRSKKWTGDETKNNGVIHPKSSFVNVKGTQGGFRPKTSLVRNKGISENSSTNRTKPMPVLIGSRASSCSTADSNPSSTITFEDSQQQQLKYVKSLSEVLGHNHRETLFSEVKIGFRKSFLNRKPSRVLVNDGQMQPREHTASTSRSGDRRSSSSKSSVGSSSHPFRSVESSALKIPHKKQSTLVSKMSETSKNKLKHSEALRDSKSHSKEEMHYSRRGNANTTTNSLQRQDEKTKVLYQTRHMKVSVPLKVKRQEVSVDATKAAEKQQRVNRPNRLARPGKENEVVTSLAIKKCNGSSLTATKLEPKTFISHRSQRTKFAGQKGKMSEGTTRNDAVFKFCPR